MNKGLIIFPGIFLILCFFGTLLKAQLPNNKFTHLSSKEGLSNHYTTSILRDSRGFMWFGTGDGLNRFDGYNIKMYKHNESDSTSISNNVIHSIIEINSGDLLIGTNEGLNRLNLATEKFTQYLHDPDDPNSLSYNRVNVIYQDDQELIWVGTSFGLNIYDPVSESFEAFIQNPDSVYNVHDRIYSVFRDSRSKIWVGTFNGLFQFDFNEKVFKPNELPATYDYNVANLKINIITEDQDGLIWIGTNRGIFKYSVKNYEYISPDQPRVNHLVEDIEMMIWNDKRYAWISTHWGLVQYDFQKNTFNTIYTIPGDHESIANHATRDVYYDENGILWIAAFDMGIDRLHLYVPPFKRYEAFGQKNDPYKYSACDFYEGINGNFWVGTGAAGLLLYNGDLNYIKSYKLRFSDNTEFQGGRVKKVLEDSKGVFWVATYNPKHGISIFNKETGIFQMLSYDTTYKHLTKRFPPKYVTDMIEGPQGAKWLGFYAGLYYIRNDESWDSLIHSVGHKEISLTTIWDLYLDNDNVIWVSTNDGLYSFNPMRSDSLDFIKYSYDSSLANTIVIPRCVFKSSVGSHWVGTNRGLFKLDLPSKVYRPVKADDPLIGTNQINSLTEDKAGNLWLGTDKGLLRYSPEKTSHFYVKLFDISDGLPYEGSVGFPLFTSKSGKIFVPAKYGTQNGFYCFHPDSIMENLHIPPVVLTDFKVRNKPFQLDSSIAYIRHILLKYNENYFSFEYAALDYISPEKNQYAYQLEGLDEDWVYADNRRFAAYTGVPAGTYIFHAKGSNNDGYWNEQGASVRITILPPPWRTWWAYTFYGIALCALLLALRWYDLKRQRLKQKLEIEQVEKDKLNELDSLKSRFFANISHEFRTPLTLILGPLDKLMSKSKDEDSQQDLGMMKRNAMRLQRLINQLLNLSKLESGKLKLHAQELNIVTLVNGYTQSFESLAKQKEINLHFESESDEIMLWVDQDKVEKILFNLLSNAFKYTGDGGRIEVVVSSRQYAVGEISEIRNNTAYRLPPTVNLPEKYIVISVTDTGSGISADKLPHIFDRFYQADDTYKSDTEGTGIGLALTKELVDLHHGQITGKSEEGRGSCFSVYLPLGAKHLSEDEKSIVQLPTVQLTTAQLPTVQLTTDNRQLTTETTAEIDTDKPIILIVEDNADMRAYIRDCLESDYQILEARDGEEGFALAIEHVPDLIISDVMMPKMDGYQFSRAVKNDERTSHVPIILLTARASRESRIEGLETGVDDFLTKPFEVDELITRINNLIQQRNILKEKYRKEFESKGSLPDIAISSMDQKFLSKAKTVLEAHMSDTDFSVETFAEMMALSRVQLHRKLRALVNQAASDFIRATRLNRAAVLLEKKSATVAEIAYEVGFTSPSHFSECFRKQFGVTPTAYTAKS